MKRRIVGCLLSLVIVTGLSACNPASNPPSSDGPATGLSTQESNPTEVTTDTMTDYSSTDMTFSNLSSGTATRTIPKPGTSRTVTRTQKAPSSTSASTKAPDRGTPVAVEKALEPLNSEEDALLWQNPDRGYRIDSWCDLYEMTLVEDPKALMKSRLLEQQPPEGMPTISQTYI